MGKFIPESEIFSGIGHEAKEIKEYEQQDAVSQGIPHVVDSGLFVDSCPVLPQKEQDGQCCRGDTAVKTNGKISENHSAEQ
ncbi:MAG: hypothetical protein IJR00_03095 [Lachnospiraceae bacterium]|nr:hypothetical protein [Lachnospiraceae bacterium]